MINPSQRTRHGRSRKAEEGEVAAVGEAVEAEGAGWDADAAEAEGSKRCMNRVQRIERKLNGHWITQDLLRAADYDARALLFRCSLVGRRGP